MLIDEEFKSLENCFDKNRPSGIRDYAIALCFMELGLRCSEVAGIKKYIDEHDLRQEDKLFLNHTGNELTRSGIRYRIACLAKKAQKKLPELKNKNISPHTFRHSTALHLLQSGVDISTIAIWLGHESITTTHKYMEADIEMKQRILEKMAEPSVDGYRYKPSKDILSFLASL